MRTLVSLSYASEIPPPAGVDVARRSSEWGVGDLRGRWRLLKSSVALAWRARRYDRVVLVTAGLELFVVAALARRTQIVAADWLLPATRKLDGAPLLRRVRFVVIRRSDGETLRRRFRATDIRFAPFPAPTRSGASSEDGPLYSAGWAHRDWPTLVAALRRTGVPAVISAGELPDLPPNVQTVEQLSPDDGRELMRAARCVALAFHDTELPSGPLVLLDAMAHGKPVVVTDVGGTRDYVTHRQDALVVPPGDVPALAAAIEELSRDEELRRRLGRAAEQRARQLTAETFWQAVLAP